MLLFGIASLAYMAFEANSIGQRADALYVILTQAICGTVLAYNILKMDDILELIEHCEAFIEKSKLDKSKTA